jgi:uncharacterized membrane-anchored protein
MNWLNSGVLLSAAVQGAAVVAMGPQTTDYMSAIFKGVGLFLVSNSITELFSGSQQLFPSKEERYSIIALVAGGVVNGMMLMALGQGPAASGPNSDFTRMFVGSIVYTVATFVANGVESAVKAAATK